MDDWADNRLMRWRFQVSFRCLLVAAALPLVIVPLAYVSHGTVVIQLGDPKEGVVVRLGSSIIEIVKIGDPIAEIGACVSNTLQK